MQILLNGESRSYERPLTVAELLVNMALTGKRVAVELNGEVVRKADYPASPLKDHDRLEVVRLVGGG